MTGPFATRIFRIVFILAGFYNLAFGLWAGLWPEKFFRIFLIPLPLYPQIWSCLGMVVGVYGLLYWYAAWKPEHGRPIITIGLLGKVLGPIGMILNISDQWPRRLAMLNLYNDVIWWLPFALFLLRGTGIAQKLVKLTPDICAAIHALGLLVMASLLRPGMATQPIALQRALYISRYPVLWNFSWSIWMCCAISLVAMYAWWGSHLASRRIAILAIALASAGSVFDLSGEFLAVLVLVERAAPAVIHPQHWNASAFQLCERTITLLTAGCANSLYTIAGMLLMFWSKALPRWVRAMMWGTWIGGAGMALAAIFHCVPGIVAATVVLFPLLIIWTFWMGRCWRAA